MINLKIKEEVHSIFNPSEFFFQTPMILLLEDKLHEWLMNGATGGVILGDYRIGKTRALQQVTNRLKNRLGENIPVKHLTVKKRDVSTIASIFRNLCYSLDLPIKSKSTSDEMANNLIHHFGELALSNSTRQVLLIVDEMQRLHIKQLEAFAELYDGLCIFKVNLIVVFVGNLHSSKSLIRQIIEKEYELIRGRFFTQSYPWCI